MHTNCFDASTILKVAMDDTSTIQDFYHLHLWTLLAVDATSFGVAKPPKDAQSKIWQVTTKQVIVQYADHCDEIDKKNKYALSDCMRDEQATVSGVHTILKPHS